MTDDDIIGIHLGDGPRSTGNCTNNCLNNTELKEYLCPDCGHYELPGFDCCPIHYQRCC